MGKKEQKGPLALGEHRSLLRPSDTHHLSGLTAYGAVELIKGCRQREFEDCSDIINLLNISEFSIKPRASPLNMATSTLNLLLCFPVDFF